MQYKMKVWYRGIRKKYKDNKAMYEIRVSQTLIVDITRKKLFLQSGCNKMRFYMYKLK